MTIYERFLQSVDSYAERIFLAELNNGSYTGLSYQDIKIRVNKLSFGLQKLNLKKGDHLAVMLKNGINWAMVDLACSQLGLIHVPIHTTYNFENIRHILENSESGNLLIDKEFLDKFSQDFSTLNFNNLLTVNDETIGGLIGDDSTSFAEKLVEDDIHTIVYTSGTTGRPKGVMLTHKNLISNIDNGKKYIDIVQTDRFFSFLPLSHMLERTGGFYVPMSSGAAIYYATSPLNISEEIKIAKPTVLLSVPRIFEKVYEKIMAKVDSGSPLKKKMFFEAITLKRKSISRDLSLAEKFKLAILDRLVLSKIRAALGGSLRFAVSGGASLDIQIARFFETLGIKIIEGYGLTETSPIIAENKSSQYKFGTVGFPLENFELKIAKDKEILVRGDSVMKGYYNNDQATAEIIDTEGWLHTGDMGFMDAEGFLTIVGRIKEIIVLSTGKKINPVPIEQALNISKYISQSMVYGDKNKHLAAFIVPDFVELNLWLREQGKNENAQAILGDSLIKDFFQHQINESLSHFDKIEQIESFKLVAEEFTQENGLVTPSLKLRRGMVFNKYNIIL